MEWISVKDRLPDGALEVEDVLTFSLGNIDSFYFSVGYWDGYKWENLSHHFEPTHWMPLPAPPADTDGN